MGSRNPKVSVVIPTYNRADKIGKTIESALAQTFPDIEVIVIDDGSSDNTGRILGEAFGGSHPLLRADQSGRERCTQHGIEQARSEWWIAFLDSDDLWEKDKLNGSWRWNDSGRSAAGVTRTPDSSTIRKRELCSKWRRRAIAMKPRWA